MIKVVPDSEKNEFNKAALHPLQSWEWGEFRSLWGNKIVRLGVYEGRDIAQGIQIIFSKIPFTKLTIGTVIKGPTPTPEILEAIKKAGKEEHALFIKLEPFDPNPKNRSEVLKLLKENCTPGKRLFTPTSFWLDLTKSEEELLKSFSSKTRYNIRLAQKHGVEVKEDNSEKAFEKYLELTKETSQRQGFYAHTKKYHELMWKTLRKAGAVHLLTATYQGEIITTWILFSWHDFLYYPYGASTEKYKNVMANNLMMWGAIKFGKGLGLKTFDLWGREEGKGFTKFKEGYNPQVVEFLGSWDLITSFLYYPYRILENIRWLILRLKTKIVKPSF